MACFTGTIDEIRADERAALMPLPPAFDGFIELSKRVSPTCLITFDRNRYNVPASFANRPVSARVYPDRLRIVAEGKILCEHMRIIQRNQRLPFRSYPSWSRSRVGPFSVISDQCVGKD